MFQGKTILITGGTGSFGKAFLSFILKKKLMFKKIIIFSRDELKQYDLQVMYPEKKFSNLRFFLGDVRDEQRLISAFEEVDYVVHAAALKQVPTAEYNPFEFITTNILGAQNIIQAALKTKVRKVIALSTDKAVAPINLYGATKLCSDKLFISANNISGKKNISFSVVRYGNVMNSRGSVLPLFLKQKKNKLFTITDKNMTRFNINMSQAVEIVFWSLKNSIGGEIFVPKIKSYKVVDLVKAVSEKIKIKYIGIRPGEKIHEEMITKNDSQYTFDINKYFVILSDRNSKVFKNYNSKKNAKKVPINFSYNSYQNKYLTVSELKKIIKDAEIQE